MADVILYAVSAVAAVMVALVASIPVFREWGRLAGPGYAAGAAIAAGLGFAHWGGRSRERALTWLAVAVLIGAALLPLGLESVWRAQAGPGLHAQSEAIITEEAALALLRGADPYAAQYLRGPLHARPHGTKTHFPYLPGMLVFGLPRAFDGSNPLADARVAFAGFTLGVVALALALPWPRRARLRHRRLSFLVLAVLPTGALAMATGGDDLPVLALMLLALVLADERRPAWAGVVGGLAAIMKQTAWILLPLLALAARGAEDRPARARFGTAAGAMLATATIPFLVWDPGAFVEDVIRFPLGLGRQRSAAGTPNLGSAITRLFPSLRGPLTVALLCVVLALFAFFLIRRPPESASSAAMEAGVVFVAAMILAPSMRFGYIAYPIDLITWSWALGAGQRSNASLVPAADHPGATLSP